MDTETHNKTAFSHSKVRFCQMSDFGFSFILSRKWNHSNNPCCNDVCYFIPPKMVKSCKNVIAAHKTQVQQKNNISH